MAAAAELVAVADVAALEPLGALVELRDEPEMAVRADRGAQVTQILTDPL